MTGAAVEGAAAQQQHKSTWLSSAWDALHLSGHHHAEYPPADLAAELLAKVKEELGPDAFGPVEEAFCDSACLQRYLRARSMDVGRAAAMLKASLQWRREFGVDNLKLGDYDSFMGEGWIYLAGLDDTGHSVMMLRKRQTRLEEDRVENFIGYLVLLLESSTRLMRPTGAEKWTWVFHMGNYSSRNSPRFDMTVRVLQLVANHYPERLNKVFIVDAPTIFWVLFKAICPFLDPVTKSKVEFVYSADAKCLAADSKAASDAKPTAAAGVDATVEVAGGSAAGGGSDGATARFLPYFKYWSTPYDRDAHLELLKSLGWPQ